VGEIVGMVLTDTEQIFCSCRLLSKREWYETVRVLFTAFKEASGHRREGIVRVFYWTGILWTS